MSTDRPRRPGAEWRRGGVDFTLFSRRAERVELCLFDAEGSETARHDLAPDGEGWWSASVPDVGPGRLYGYRVHGRWSPAEGLWFNPAKLLMDPDALAVTGEPVFDEANFAFDPADPLAPDERDNAASAPRSVVVDRRFDWDGDRPPRTPWSDTLIYECHVRGTTRGHPQVDEELCGTYLGLCSDPILDHLERLGVTAVELLPVHQIASEPHLGRRGLTNYFGYSPLGFLAPHAGYATGNLGQQVVEFKRMVRRFHAAGIEVLLDVVFNHTAEGGADGPMLSLRGIDNPSYYRLDPADRGSYVDWTGCGNTLDLRQDAALDLVERALVHWVEEMHVDGFRFDLAPVLARGEAFEPEAAFFERLRSRPSLAEVKLIAEPWDLGPAGYRLGWFPPPWREWNDRFRDAARAFWRSDRASAGRLFAALGGSHDVFPEPRGPLASVDFVTCHDGFTLEDLVSYEAKRNRANGEANRDGSDANLSRNWGVEGPTDDPEIRALRRRAKRNLFVTLALGRGVAMLSHGDELGRTQHGNNNAYCHDDETTWIDWDLDDERAAFLAFCRSALSLRRQLDRDEEPLVLLGDGSSGGDPSKRRLPLLGLWRPRARLLMLFNGTDRERRFSLPTTDEEGGTGAWEILLDTADGEARSTAGGAVDLSAHSVLVARHRPAS